MSLLRSLELWLQDTLEGQGRRPDLEPLDVVRQVEREIERNKKAFVNDQVYVPHRVLVHLLAPTSARVDEYEVLFNRAEFREHLERYIRDRGYKLLDRLRVTIQCHRLPTPEFGGRGCYLEFSWPPPGSAPGDVTVVLDPSSPERILRATREASQVGEDAWVEVTRGHAYESPVRIESRQFNIGRMRQIVNADSGDVLRVNHLAFQQADRPDDVNRTVSRRHGAIVNAKGTFVLVDTGGENRTAVLRGTSTIMAPKREAAGDGIDLKDGDLLLFGDAEVRFHLGPLPRVDDAGAAGGTA